MIDGIAIKLLKRIPDDRGKILHIMRNDEEDFRQFGEVYCSTVFPGVIKAWHKHERMTLNYAVVTGMIKFVLYDDRRDSQTFGEIQEIYLGDDHYCRVTVPPGIWNGFMGIGLKEAYVINFTDIPHDPTEIIRKDPFDPEIPFNWGIKHR